MKPNNSIPPAGSQASAQSHAPSKGASHLHERKARGSASLLVLAAALVFGPGPTLHAQTGEWVLIPSNAVPQFANFYSLQLTNWPPLPANPFPEREVWRNNAQPDRLWYNDLALDYEAYFAQWQIASAVNQLQSRYGLSTDDANAVVALGDWVMDGLNAETAGAGMMQLYTVQPGDLYLEMAGVNSNANLTLHGTSSDQVYSLLTVTDLANPVWQTAQAFSGAAGQDWTDLSVAGGAGSNQLFFRAMRWSTNDQSGDGISVTLTNPADGASFDLWPTNLTLQATASATNGSILAVAFYYGTNLLGVSYGAEYSLAWNNIGRGRYTLYARAFDCNGASATSQAVQISIEPCYPALDVALVMDISSSMAGTPLDNAKAAGSNFIQKLNPTFDMIGLASFASNAVINTNLTSDLAGVTALLNGLVHSSGTRIDYGISTGQLVLANSPRHPPEVLPAMILLTDGNADDNTSNLVFTAAQAAKDAGTRLFTLGIGNDVDTNLLRTIASHTTDFYYAPDSTNLNALYDSIATKLCRTNAAPSVSILSPTNWATFTAGSNLTLQATASDPDGTIASVQFFNNGSFIGTPALVGSVYQLIWSEAPIGTNSLTAVATDNFGLAGTSQSIIITVTHPPPTVHITSPTNGQLFVLSPTNIVIEAEASATDAVITNVQFFCGTTNLGQTASSPYQALWTNATAGSNYTLTAMASDSMGATATNWVTVSVNAMPVVWITYPTNTTPTNLATFLEVTNVTLQARATDSDGVITNLQFWCPTGQISGVVFTNNGTNFSLTLSNCHHGAYPITAIARDNQGASTVSAIRVFKVASSNLPPSVSLTNPLNGAVFSAGADLTVCATASSTNGIALVEFFQNGVRLGGDNTPPYQLEVQGLWPGTYQFCAKATDSNGLTCVSAVITNTIQDWVPLSANGYWDPDFHPVHWLGGWNPNRVPLALGASNQIFALDWYYSDTAAVEGWQSCGWLVPAGLEGLRFAIHTLVSSGANLLLGGGLDYADPDPYTVASYNGTSLTNLSFGLNANNGEVWALHEFKGDLIAGGSFTGTNENVKYIAKLSGNTWVPLGSPLDGNVVAIASIGDDLYIGGDFTSAGGDTNIAYVAKLVGTNWVALGSGVNNPTTNWILGDNGAVAALAVWNGQLVAGGCFTQAGGDTNAACLAKWDGTSWSALGSTRFSSDDDYFPPFVSAVAVHGNDLFVAGLFDSVTVGSDRPLRLGNVAHLQWDPAGQTWNWHAMDMGLTNQFMRTDRAWAGSLLLRRSTISNALEVIVGGSFDQAGPVVSCQVARWIIGANDCANAYRPSVNFEPPLSSRTTYDPGESIGVAASASPATGLEITSITFYTNGVWLGAGLRDWNTNGYHFYLQDYLALPEGIYRLDAMAVDSSNLANEATIYVTVASNLVAALTNPPASLSNAAPVLGSDLYSVLVNDPPTPLYVLANDGPAALGLKSVSPLPDTKGTVAIAPGGTNLIFQPAPNTYGTVMFTYSATNALGIAGYATVTVKIRVKPIAALGTPADGASFPASSNVVVTGAVLDYDTTNTSLAFYVNGSLVQQYAPTNLNYLSQPTNFFFNWNPAAACPQTSYALFSFNWTTNVPGYYKVTVMVTDSYGYVSSSDLLTPLTVALTNSFTATNHLIASLDNLPVTTNVSHLVSYTVIHDGLFDLSGKARDPIGSDPLSYQLLLYQPSTPGTPVANVTPLPRDADGFHPGGDITNSLGTLDLSAVPNGTYDLVLTVHGGGAQTNATARFILDSQLKIGQFSFSEQDLLLPVNGIPLTVTRSYNSLQANSQLSTFNSQLSSDFGPGWTLALNSMDVQLDDERQDVQIGSDAAPWADDEESESGPAKTVSIRIGGGWDVTLTLPDGRRATFAFNPRLDPWNGKAYAQWSSPPGVYAVLTNFDALETEIDSFLSPRWASDDNTFSLPVFECHDVPGWVLTNLDGTAYYLTRGAPNNVVYDTTGYGNFVNVRAYGPPTLTKIVQRAGDTITIGASGVAHYAPNATNATRSVWFDRDRQHRITALHDMISGSNGLPVVKYVYDQQTGNLIQVLKLTDRAAGTYTPEKYHYDNPNFPHYITWIENALGIPVARNLYDSSGKLIAVVDANNNTNQVIHNLTNRLEIVIDPLGRTNITAYDLRGNVTATTNALGGVTLRAYDDNNNKTNEILILNGVRYSTNNATFDPTSGLLLTAVDALGSSNVFTYNANGQLLTSTDALGHSSTNFYDPNTGNLLGTEDALGGTTTNLYDSTGLLVSATDAAGAATTNQYDSLGNLAFTRIGYYSNNTFLALTSTGYGYDNDGNCVAVTNGLGVVTRYLFDGQSRVIATTNAWGTADQTVTQTIYDAAGRVVQTVDARGATNAFGYDFQGRRTSVTHALGTTVQQVTQSIYDAAGNCTNQVDNLGRVTDFQYDALNRQTVTLLPAATSGAARTGITNAYDGLDRRIAVTNQAGVGTGFQFDLLSRMTAVTNALGKVTQYQFDRLGNQTNQIDALTRSTKFAYDAVSRRTQRTMPGNQAEKFGYDPGSRLLAQTNFDGTIITNQYDFVGRLLKRCNGGTVLETYAYSATGQLTNRTDASGTYTWVYDNLGRLKTNSTPVGTLYYTYDANGNLLSLSSSTANGVSLTYQYDALNRLTNVIDNRLMGTKSTSYTFDGAGNLRSLAYPNGITNLWQYDALNRLTNLTWKLSGAQRGDFAYQLGAAGNRTNLVDNVGGTNRTFSWAYDSLYRLTTETVTGASPTGSLGYVYDDVGNRTSRTGTLDSLTASSNAFDVNDWLDNDSITNNANPYFDANGNMRTNGSIYYGYDSVNRLTGYTNGSTVVTLVYDADRNRVQKVTANATTLYLVATVNPSGYAQVVEEFTVSGGVTNLSQVYSCGLELISERQAASGTVSFYGYDGHGSTRFLTSTNGTITDTYTYDAYGTLITSAGSTPNNYLYSGEQWDPDLGLYYLRARYYSPALGRFWTMDGYEGSRFEPSSLHKYLYSSCDPADRIDPSGQDDFSLTSLLATAGTIATMASQQIGAIVQRAGPAFAAGGRQAGIILQEFGAVAENAAYQVIRLAQTSAANLQVFERVTRGSRFIDFSLRYGQRAMDLEVKYKLPSETGEALTRLLGQAQASVTAAQGQTVIWTLKEPTVQELRLVTTQLGAAANRVQFVSGVDGLLKYIALYFGL